MQKLKISIFWLAHTMQEQVKYSSIKFWYKILRWGIDKIFLILLIIPIVLDILFL